MPSRPGAVGMIRPRACRAGPRDGEFVRARNGKRPTRQWRIQVGRRANKSCASNCPQTCPQGCSETGRIAWGQTALILKPPQARGASSVWPIRGIMERCRAPGMAKNSLYRGLPSRCQNPGCISRYICKFVAKRPAGICLPATEQALLRQRTAGRRSSQCAALA